jgi:hypothetical protein
MRSSFIPGGRCMLEFVALKKRGRDVTPAAALADCA